MNPLQSAALSHIDVFLCDYARETYADSQLWKDISVAAPLYGSDHAWIDRLHQDDQARARISADRLIEGSIESVTERFRIIDQAGEERWVRIVARIAGSDTQGRAANVVGTVTEITKMVRTEQTLHAQEEELETLREVAQLLNGSLNLSETIQRIFEHTHRIIPFDTATVQVLEQGNLRVIGGYGFENVEEIMALRFAYPEAGSLSTKAIDARAPIISLDVTKDFPAFVQPADDQQIHSWIGIPLVHHDSVIGLLAADAFKKAAYNDSHLTLASTIADHVAIALENARLHEETYRMAMSDELTRVGSRRGFALEGRILFEDSRRHRRPISALMVDIDRFKSINDTFGHSVGDQILKRVARTCADSIRTSDVLARYGGEEFVALLPATDCEAALITAERIRTRIARQIHPETGGAVSVSIGISSILPERSDRLEALVESADQALYKAKNDGRNCSVASPGCTEFLE